jgi:hypothetical protein
MIDEILEQHDVLVSSVTRQCVALAYAPQEPVCDFHEHFIADVVPEPVVDTQSTRPISVPA